MTTIGNYSVSIGLAADGLIQGGMLARRELTALTGAFRSVVDPSEKLAKQLDVVEKALAKGAISEETAIAVKERLRSKIEQIANSASAAARSVEAMNAKIARTEPLVAQTSRVIPQSVTDGAAAITRSVAAAAAGYFALSTAASAVRTSIGKSIEVENSLAQFEVLIGSAQKAQKMLGDLRKLAVESPLTLGDTTQAARTLLSFNVAADQIMPTLKMLGDVTGGNSERFKMISLAFAQASAAGRLMGQDLLQMINAGFNPLQERSKRTGQSLIELRKLMEDGGYSAKMMAEDFRLATSEGGRFYGMIDKIGTTTGGAMQIAQGAIELLQIQLGESLSPLLRQVATDLSELTKNTDKTKAAFDGAGQSALGFYNFLKSEISLVPALGRSVGFLGDSLGQLADVFTSDKLFSALQKTKTVEDAQKLLVEASKNDKVQFESIVRRYQQKVLGTEMNREGTPPPYLVAIERTLKAIREQEQKLQSLGEPTKESPLSAQASKVATKYDTMLGTLKQQLERLKDGKAAATELKAEMAGFTAAQQKTISALAQEIDMIEKRNKAEKERARLQREAATIIGQTGTLAERTRLEEEKIERLYRAGLLTLKQAATAKDELIAKAMKEGFAVRDSIATPMERLVGKVLDYRRLVASGQISASDAEKAIQMEAKKSQFKIELPKAAEKGSVEDYRRFVEAIQRQQQTQLDNKLAQQAKANADRVANAVNRVESAVNNVAASIKRKR